MVSVSRSVNMGGPFKICLFLAIFQISSSFAGIPVLLWESNSVSEKDDLVPALSQLDGDEFSNHFIKKIRTHQPLIFVFVEETLSVEDFSWKDDSHIGAFPKLENITGGAAKVEFIPSVIDPIGSLKDLVRSHGYSYQKFDRAERRYKPGTALEVDLSDPFITEDRHQLLRRHDGDISHIYSDVLDSSPWIVAVFTGRQSSWVEAEVNRVRREANSSMTRSIAWKASNIMIAAKSAKLIVNNTTYDLGNPSEIKTDDREKNNFSRLIYVYTTEDKTKITLRIRFNYDKTSWSIGDSEVEVSSLKLGPLSPKNTKSVPLGQSLTEEEFVLENPATNTTLVFSDFQAEKFKKAGQILFSETSGSSNQFFTGGIWMGIIVSWTLLIILAWGITMLMDIRTMDRFDDPKGKTITVNVLE